jgi:KaiC/GvpD/RAD55 family RecA-like ATPase
VWEAAEVSAGDTISSEGAAIGAKCLPTMDEALRDWALGVYPLEGFERRLAVADKMTALEGIVDDPQGECERALARVSGGERSATTLATPPSAQAQPLSPTEAQDFFLDWSTFWDHECNEAEWLYPDVLARGRGHSIYAVHKAGKSLLMLHIAAKLATGSEPVAVVYLDYEMTEADVRDRLEDMGYGPDSDFSRLRYALLPSLPPLDAAAGAEALMEVIDTVKSEWPDHHVAVVIDTISRAVHGKENDADTFRDFYNHTGIQLKRRGVTWARLDHGGKDAERGQRGSSGKGDDVDVVWKLSRTQNGVHLHREVARMPWVPSNVTFGAFDEPLRHVRLTDDWPEGTDDVARVLDGLGVPLHTSTRAASRALKDAKAGRRRQLVVAAVRWRVQRAELGVETDESGSGTVTATPSLHVVPEPANARNIPSTEPLPEPAGTTGTGPLGTGFPLSRGEPVPHPTRSDRATTEGDLGTISATTCGDAVWQVPDGGEVLP